MTTETIKLRFSTIDRTRNTKTFKTLAGARKAAHERLGAHPEIGQGYAVSGDGVVKVVVTGATLADIFPWRGTHIINKSSPSTKPCGMRSRTPRTPSLSYATK